jgi:hypothetical protein
MKNLKFDFVKLLATIHNMSVKFLFASLIILTSVVINSFSGYMIDYFSNLPDGGSIFVFIFQTIIVYLYAKFVLFPLPKLLDKYLKWFKENTDVTNT